MSTYNALLKKFSDSTVTAFRPRKSIRGLKTYSQQEIKEKSGPLKRYSQEEIRQYLKTQT